MAKNQHPLMRGFKDLMTMLWKTRLTDMFTLKFKHPMQNLSFFAEILNRQQAVRDRFRMAIDIRS